MALQDMQHMVNGFVIGAPSVVRLDNVLGMGLGPTDEKKYGIAGAGGYRWGRERRRGNLVTFEGAIVVPGNPGSAYDALRQMRTAWDAQNILGTPDAVVGWTYKMPGHPETTVMGRPRTLDAPLRQLALGLIPFVATFECKVGLTV